MKLKSIPLSGVSPAYTHQTETTTFILKTPRCLITSDPGTGKTRSVLDALVARKKSDVASATLVIAPLSILEAAWGDDIKKFQPDIKYGVAYASNRAKIFSDDSFDVVVTNFEAVNFLCKNQEYLKNFNTLVVDEFTAFKNRSSKRSKNLKKIISHFDHRIFMSGTPNTNTILDIWHPVLCVDDGDRLGKRFFGFRGQVCTPKFNGFANEWVDKPGIEEAVAQLLSDINIRYALEDCIDLPDNVTRIMHTNLTRDVKQMYDTLAEESVLYTNQGTINTVNAGARVKKLLQLVSGAVYDELGDIKYIHQNRYDMIMDLLEVRKHSLVAFNWKHERNALTQLADKKGFSYEVIDG